MLPPGSRSPKGCLAMGPGSVPVTTIQTGLDLTLARSRTAQALSCSEPFTMPVVQVPRTVTYESQPSSGVHRTRPEARRRRMVGLHAYLGVPLAGSTPEGTGAEAPEA